MQFHKNRGESRNVATKKSDRQVDGSDVTILADNWQYGVTATAVPEPATLVMLLTLAALAMLRKRRK